MTFKELGPDDVDLACRLFEAMQADPLVQKHFRPHPLTQERAEQICCQPRQDYYMVGLIGEAPAAYGILRGWDEGFQRPTAGMVVLPEFRGRGYGTAVVRELIQEAQRREAPSVLVHIDLDNLASRRIFEKLGFTVTSQHPVLEAELKLS